MVNILRRNCLSDSYKEGNEPFGLRPKEQSLNLSFILLVFHRNVAKSDDSFQKMRWNAQKSLEKLRRNIEKSLEKLRRLVEKSLEKCIFMPDNVS